MHSGSIGTSHQAPPSVLRRLALGTRIAARAASRHRLADEIVERRSPKLLPASTRISSPREVRAPAEVLAAHQRTRAAAEGFPAGAVTPAPVAAPYGDG